MFLIKRKKLIFGVLAFSMLSTSIMAAQRNNQRDAPQEPLRVPLEREALIDDLTSEKINRQLFPVDEEEAVKYRENLLNRERVSTAPVVDPEIMFRKINIDTSRKEDNKVVYLSPNYVTTLVFLDKNGAQWPIENYLMALGKNIANKDLSNSSLVFAPKDVQFARTNLVVTLKGSNTPIIMTVEISPEKVDYKADVIVNDYGPNSTPVVYRNPNAKQDFSFMASFVKEDMYSMLEGITPSEAYVKRRTSLPEDVEVWVKDKVMYVRSKDMLISPSLIPTEYNKMQSPDNTFLYTVPYMNVIVLSRHGQMTQIKIY